LSKNWPASFELNLQPPETVAEAVDRLMLILDDEQKRVLAAIAEDELIDLHFSLGLAIRNAFGLHEPGSKLLADCGVLHPDDGAGIIVRELWSKLWRTLQS
jgi:uncharacterized protein DUF6794